MTHNSPVNFKLIRFLLWIYRSHQSNKELLEFIRPSPNSIFDIHNPYGIKLLTRLRLSLSHLNEYKFKHGFNDAINTICICGGDIESISISVSTPLNTVKQEKPSLTTFKALIKCY